MHSRKKTLMLFCCFYYPWSLFRYIQLHYLILFGYSTIYQKKKYARDKIPHYHSYINSSRAIISFRINEVFLSSFFFPIIRLITYCRYGTHSLAMFIHVMNQHTFNLISFWFDSVRVLLAYSRDE